MCDRGLRYVADFQAALGQAAACRYQTLGVSGRKAQCVRDIKADKEVISLVLILLAVLGAERGGAPSSRQRKSDVNLVEIGRLD